MHTYRLLLLLSAALSMASVAPLLAAKDGSTPAPAESKHGKPALEQGMTGDEITRILGRPAAIEPMKAPEGRAEVWVYRRVLETRGVQVQTGTRQVPGFVGGPQNGGVGMINEPILTIEHQTVYQVTRLLLFNDKLVSAKQSREVSRNYDH